jgi:CubicO group peptidase (beta-lactamase class C family)
MRFWPALASDAVGHAAVAGEFQVVDAGPWTDVGSGGIMTTPSELARWADHIRKASLVRAATFDQALLDAVEAPKLEEGNRYGPGLRVRADGSLWHGGHGEGELTRFEVSADRHTAMAITCNHKSIDPADISAHLRSIWAVTPEGG